MLALDASMTLAWLFERVKSQEAKLAGAALRSLDQSPAIVPALWHTEVANALLVGERRKVITEAQTIDYLARLSRLPIHTDDSAPGARRDILMALGREYSLTAYDAAYLDLALRRGAALASFDNALTEAMRRAGGSVFGGRT